jgi:hypothetical protein
MLRRQFPTERNADETLSIVQDKLSFSTTAAVVLADEGIKVAVVLDRSPHLCDQLKKLDEEDAPFSSCAPLKSFSGALVRNSDK